MCRTMCCTRFTVTARGGCAEDKMFVKSAAAAEDPKDLHAEQRWHQ